MIGRASCPICGEVDLVAKASSLYVLGVERKLHHASGGAKRRTRQDSALNVGREHGYPLPRMAQELTSDELVILSQRLAPPAAPKPSSARILHPDLVVLTFSLIIPVFLSGIYSNQRSWLLPLAVVLVLAYGLYFWQRRALIARFETRKSRDLAADERIRRAMERWMRLYYCARDDVVFDPELNLAEDADRMAGFLIRE